MGWEKDMKEEVIRVLYVDDEVDLLEIGKVFIEDTGDFSVTTLDSAKAALDLIGVAPFDAIVSDYQMPVMDGIQFLCEVRSRFGTIPFILFTGKGREEVVIQAINNGADFYLQKGGDPDAQFAELAHKIRQAVARRTAERALRGSEEQFRSYVDDAPEGIFLTDENGQYHFVNDAACGTTGYSREELLQKNLIELIFPEDLPKAREHFQRVVETGSASGELRFVTRDGEVRWWVVKAVRLSPIRFLGFTSDITDRKRSEEALYESEEKYRQLVELAQEGIWVIDANGITTFVNRRMEEILGYAPGEMVGRPLFSFMDDAGVAIAQQKIERRRKGIAEQHDFEFFRKDGQKVFTSLETSPLMDDNGNYGGAFAMVADITERKSMEEALRKSEERLANLNQLLSGVLEHTHMMAVFLDVRFNFIWVNRAYATTCRHDPSFFPGKNHFDLYPHEENQEIFQRVVDTGTPFFVEGKPFTFPDQPERGVTYWDWSLIPVKDGHGRVTGIVFTLMEVTERIAAEMRLAESEERFRLANKATREVVWDWDVIHDTQTWNESGTVVFGWTEIVEHPVSAAWWVERVHPEDRQRVEERFFEVVHNPEANYWGDEYRFLKTDGTYARVMDRGYVARDVSGKAVRMIGAMLDITERKRAEEALDQNRELLQAVIDNSQYFIYAKDLEGRFILVSQSLADFFGQQRTQLLGKTSHDFLPKESADQHWANDCEVMAQEKLLRIEETVATPHGQLSYLTTKFPLFDSEGRLYAVCGVSVDITERKHAEEALQVSESRFRNAFEHSAIGMALVSPEGKWLKVNKRVCDIVGYTEDELMRKTFQDITHPEDLEADLGFVRRMLAGEIETYQMEKRYFHRDGHIVWVLLAVSLVRDEHGSPLHFISQIKDITDQKFAEDKLQEILLYTRGLIEASLDPQVTISSKGLITDVNRATEHVTGLSRDALIGTDFADYFTDPDKAKEGYAQAFTSGFVKEYPLTIRHRSGQTTDVLYNASVYTDHSGAVRGVFAAAHDVTRLKQVEEALRTVNRKLNLLTAITRHDITNQLAIIQSYTALLAKNQHDPTLTERLRKINAAAERISAMIRFTKEYENIGVKNPSWQDSRQLVKAAAQEAPLGQVQVRNDLPAGTEVFADPLISKVFYNLMENAARHGGKITTVWFTGEKAGDSYLIICGDDGDGIPADEKEKIFDRGYGKNTGLGLFLTREILGITGITIQETGEPGKGARFEIMVPKGAYRETRPGERAAE